MNSVYDARVFPRSLPPITPSGNTTMLADETKRGESSRRVAGARGVTSNLPSAADLYVPSLPGVPDMATHPTHPIEVYAGNIPSYPGEGAGGGVGATGVDATLFFMMIKARRAAGKQRVILWFNGGPGCSSFDGSLMEIGPFRTVSESKTKSGMVEVELVEGGWEEYATVIFIDQPPGTGYSFVPTNGYLHDLDEGSAHLIQFLQNLYHIFPELSSVDTYLAGESFAGQYIPYFAKGLLATNLLPNFKLAGVAIGNGWIDGFEQYPAYVDFAYEKGLIKKDSAPAQEMEAILQQCMDEIARVKKNGDHPVNLGGGCGGVMSSVTDPFVDETNGKKTCMNVYDVRLVDDWPACGMNWPPDLGDVYKFLRRPDVVTALHANKKETAWVECDGRVGSELTMYNSPSSSDLLPGILEAGVPILMFAGAEDLICNYKGIERICDGLIWDGKKGMGNSTSDEWFINGTQVGTWRTHRNLTYAKVYDSSHMVGFDVPHVTNDMITRFMEVDFSLLPGIASSSKSRVGSIDRVQLGLATTAAAGIPLLKGGNTDWEAAYNVGSALMILLFLISIVGLYFFFRRKAHLRRQKFGIMDAADGSAEERVPLGALHLEDGMGSPRGKRLRKGKGRARDPDSPGLAGGGRYTPPMGGERGHGHGHGRGHSRGGSGPHGGSEAGSEFGSPAGTVMFALGDEEEDEAKGQRGGGGRR